MKYFEQDVIFDIEIYGNIFTLCAISADGKEGHVFEISPRKDNRNLLFKFLDRLNNSKMRLVGFNNLSFDYGLLHFMLNNRKCSVEDIYNEAQRIINSFKDDRFGSSIPSKKHYVSQVDLYKINHFDNAAKATSLKILKFNMRLKELQDLPFEVGSFLTSEEMDELILYNIDDVIATLNFYYENYSALELREKLSAKYESDFTNYSDSKIGGEIFINELEKVKKGSCYKFVNGKREIRQTKRNTIDFSDIMLPYVELKRPEFKAIKEWFEDQVIEGTKGVFSDIPEHKLGDIVKYCNLVTKKSKKMSYIPPESEIKAFLAEFPLGWVEDKTPEQKYSKKDNKPLKIPTPSFFFCWKVLPKLSVIINDHEYVYGTGGIHSSVSPQIVTSDNEYLIVDLDVESYYPNISILHEVYPEHLSNQFCKTYSDLFEQRKSYPKGSADNLSIKLALNSTYGNSNNKYSPFYDPKYTMKITVNGQISLCMLIERILELPEAISIQSNTDGITMKIRREDSDKLDSIVSQWEKETKYKMERNDYSVMYIRDVNNYAARYMKTNKLKLKGAYAHELEHHKNQSALIVKKAVAAHIETGESIESIIMNHKNEFDFMLRTKIPRSMSLVVVDNEGNETEQQNVSRYYVSSSDKAGSLIKIMPPNPNKESTEDRRSGICVGYKVIVCNNIIDFSWDIDYNYYIQAANKLMDVFTSDEDIE